MQGDVSHDLVKTAIHSLSCMTHRGGIAADGKTGDGCGLLLAMPKQFFREEAKNSVILRSVKFCCRHGVFKPRSSNCSTCKTNLTKEIEAEGCRVLAWRVIPTNNDALGSDCDAVTSCI